MNAQMNHQVERRHQRSMDPLEALGLQLDHTARQCGLQSLVLADRDGLFIAGGGESGADLAGSEVASMCPLVVREGGNCYDGMLDVPGDRDMSVLMFDYRGQTLYLGAVTSEMQVSSSDAVLHAMEGVMRILG